MANIAEISLQIGKNLGQLGAFCDTGFALAVHIRFTSPSLLYRTYGSDWIEFYSAQGFMLQDPVVRWGLAHQGSVTWGALGSTDPAGVIAASVAHGLTNGWTYSTGPANSRTLSGFTKSGAAFSDDEMDQIRAIVKKIHDLTEGIEHFSAADLTTLRALAPS
jgi:LuxR family transcriptional regulator